MGQVIAWFRLSPSLSTTFSPFLFPSLRLSMHIQTVNHISHSTFVMDRSRRQVHVDTQTSEHLHSSNSFVCVRIPYQCQTFVISSQDNHLPHKDISLRLAKMLFWLFDWSWLNPMIIRYSRPENTNRLSPPTACSSWQFAKMAQRLKAPRTAPYAV